MNTITGIISIAFCIFALSRGKKNAGQRSLIHNPHTSQIQQNKRRLAASQCQARNATIMDQATRAMLAVFISNLIFGIPHSIHHLMGKQPHYMKVIFHVLFSTHFMVDPLAFVWFNSGYRLRVAAKIRKVTQTISPPPSSALPVESAPDSDHQQQSSVHKQRDFNI